MLNDSGPGAAGDENIKTAIIVAAALSALTTALPAGAVTVAWTLTGATIDDGCRAAGTFTINSTTGRVNGYDITTTPGAMLVGFHYDATTSFLPGNNVTTGNFVCL